jgi:hypothetical protein
VAEERDFIMHVRIAMMQANGFPQHYFWRVLLP